MSVGVMKTKAKSDQEITRLAPRRRKMISLHQNKKRQ
jgi:hypothetical protein